MTNINMAFFDLLKEIIQSTTETKEVNSIEEGHSLARTENKNIIFTTTSEEPIIKITKKVDVLLSVESDKDFLLCNGSWILYGSKRPEKSVRKLELINSIPVGRLHYTDLYINNQDKGKVTFKYLILADDNEQTRNFLNAKIEICCMPIYDDVKLHYRDGCIWTDIHDKTKCLVS